MKILEGLAISPGVSFGRAVVFKYDIKVPEFRIPYGDVKLELLKFDAALALSREQLLAVKDRDGDLDETIAKILESQLLILVDPLFVGEVVNRVREEKWNVEKVLSDVVADFSRMFDNMKDGYLKERASDVRDVGGRILRNLLGEDPPPLQRLEKDSILVCDHLNVSEVARIDPERVVAMISEVGGETSHPAILARSLGIPSIVGVPGATGEIRTGDSLIVDCVKGLVIVDPTQDQLEEYGETRRQFELAWERLLEESSGEDATIEGESLEFLANISIALEVGQLSRFGANGVGLFRSEYLYMNQSTFPPEDVQYESYRKVIEGCSGGKATIRTLDIGGDKELPYLCLIKEANPFLGWRSIRFCLDNPELFLVQLRAILRASVHGPTRLMFPMISELDELRRARDLLREAADGLRRDGVPFGDDLEVGMMIEVPSAAVMVDNFVGEVDFFSIGTNDLTQFTLAVDRTNRKLAKRFDCLSPAVLRLVDRVVRAAGDAGKAVGCCGEMAASDAGFLLLLGLGLREFSCNVFAIPGLKRMSKGVRLEEVEKAARQALSAATAAEVRQILAPVIERTIERAGSVIDQPLS